MASEIDRIQPKYRTFWRRFFAGIIDGIVFVPVYLLESVIVEDTEFNLVSGNSLGSVTTVENAIIITAVNTLLMFWYSAWMTGKYGQTIGKMATKIMVLDEQDEKSLIRIRRAIYRDSPLAIAEFIAIIYMIITLDVSEKNIAIKLLNFATGIWVLAELITMFQNVRRRAIHDILAGSVVVKI